LKPSPQEIDMQGTATHLGPQLAVGRAARPAAPAASRRALHPERLAARLSVVPAAALERLGTRARRLLRADD
jgi:hypothetical protein